MTHVEAGRSRRPGRPRRLAYNCAMDRRSTAFRWMARLALVAVLLTVAVPTASHVVSTLAPTLAPVLMEMCTTAGLQVRDVSALLSGDEPAPPPAPSMDACDYCVLSAP